MKKFNLDECTITFKNIISGPAPVGRILNYIYITGNNKLKHKNGNRTIDLNNNIGSAWTTEFMLGLELVELSSAIGGAFILKLTKNGKKIFDLMPSPYQNFDEGVTLSSISLVRAQMNTMNPTMYDTFKTCFLSSLPFKILREYILEFGFYYSDRKKFIDDYFETIKKTYDSDPSPYNRNARTTTGDNRMPSLLQLCLLFDLLVENDRGITFDVNVITNPGITFLKPKSFTSEELKKIDNNDKLLYNDLKDLANRYGIDGTVLTNSVARNSYIQNVFKQNLLSTQGCKCIICGIEKQELLIGSHIKPAAESDVYEKFDINNGLLLCCNHDKLFDRYLITFNFIDGAIELSKSLSQENIDKLDLDVNFSLPDELLTNERVSYLMEHNATFHNKETKR